MGEWNAWVICAIILIKVINCHSKFGKLNSWDLPLRLGNQRALWANDYMQPCNLPFPQPSTYQSLSPSFFSHSCVISTSQDTCYNFNCSKYRKPLFYQGTPWTLLCDCQQCCYDCYDCYDKQMLIVWQVTYRVQESFYKTHDTVVSKTLQN